MIHAVTNTTPLRYLIEIGAIDLLPHFYKQVATPPAVIEELLQPTFPEPVKAWASKPPEWLIVRAPTGTEEVPALSILHQGESDAIRLAAELGSTRLFIDERDGVKVLAELRRQGRAKALDCSTLALLALAREEGYHSDESFMQKLVNETRYRVNAALAAKFLGMDADVLRRVQAERDYLKQGPRIKF